MTCEEMEPVLGAWLAGEIRPDERAAAETHLLDCAACRADFELARSGWRAEWPGATAPALKPRAPRALVFLKLGTAAAVALIGALALVERPAPPRSEPVLASFVDTLGAIRCVDEEGRPSGDLGLKEHRVSVEILDGVSLTTVEETFENRSDRRLEGTFRFPLPQDAAISRLALEVNGKMEEGTCLERQRAREVFESIVRRAMDPALLEWLPGGIFQCRIFPIEPRSTKRVLVGYTQVLPFARGKSTYVYPLAAEKTREHPPERLTIDVRARFSGTLAAMASPTHRIDVQRRDVHEAAAAFRASNLRPTSDFVLELETADDEVRLVAHKEGTEDGYVACFVAPRLAAPRAPRRYALLVDASASVSAPAFEAAKKVVDALKRAAIPGDSMQVAAFAMEVEDLERARPLGGCDLLKALKSVDADETILIGEATPTLGETDRAVILESVKGRRIRTIAVGSEVEIGFLEKLGPVARISPGEDVARRAAEIATTLGAPVVRNLRIEGPVEDVVGARDVFAGERVFLAARYKGAGGRLTVTADGWRREIEAPLPPQETANAWVKRLWAQRRVSDLTDPAAIAALGVKHQIMTPYTSFLVLETEKMWEEHQLKRQLGERERLLAKSGAAESEAQAAELPTKREVTRKMAHLLELTYMAFDQKRYDRCLKLCDELLLIDPGYQVVKELREDIQKTRHKEEYYGVLARKVEDLKRRTDDDDEAVIPDAKNVRIPSRDEWAEISKRITEGVIRTEGASIDEFRVKMEPADLALSKHLRDGERFLNAGMYDKAQEEFRAARRSPAAFPHTMESDLRVDRAERLERSFRSVNPRRPKGISDMEESLGEIPWGNRTSDRDVDPFEGWRMGADRTLFFEKQAEWDGGVIPLVSPTGGGGPILGATFTLDELTRPAAAPYSRFSSERLEQDLAQWEERVVDMSREKQLLEEKINAIALAGGSPAVSMPGRKPLEGKVTAVANEIGLVVISIGKDAGALEGDEFTIFRGGDFVAKIVIDRIDRSWAAGKIVLRKSDPRVADDASNHVYVAGPRGTSNARIRDVFPDGSARLEENWSLDGQTVAATRDGRFVALLDVRRGRAIPRPEWTLEGVQPGDRIERVKSVEDFIRSLPEELRLDLASKASIRRLRARLEAGR
jgi:Ca-activated chloride channel homolog